MLYIFISLSCMEAFTLLKVKQHLPLLRSFCQVFISLSRFVSLANWNTLLSISLSKSMTYIYIYIYIYIKYKIGRNTDPCGSPLKTDFQFETSPSTITLCLLSVSHFSIQLVISFPMPWAFSLSNSLWCGTLMYSFFLNLSRLHLLVIPRLPTLWHLQKNITCLLRRTLLLETHVEMGLPSYV